MEEKKRKRNKGKDRKVEEREKNGKENELKERPLATNFTLQAFLCFVVFCFFCFCFSFSYSFSYANPDPHGLIMANDPGLVNITIFTPDRYC